jgi:hypothetical protein
LKTPETERLFRIFRFHRDVSEEYIYIYNTFNKPYSQPYIFGL